MPTEPSAYDRVAPHYDRAMRPLERMGLRRLRAKLFARVCEGLPQRALLLEVGAGTGANFRLYPPGAEVAASEPSREMLARAAMRRAGLRARVSLVLARAERLPFACGTFDAALATLVFCTVESPAAGLAELRRVVRLGGTIALLEHVRPRGPLGYAFDALSLATVPLCGDHFNRRTAEEARRAGLRVTRVEDYLLGALQLIFCRVE